MTSTRVRIENGLVVGNTYDKYGTSNPIARRLMKGFLDDVQALALATGAKDIHEVGCGEGKLSAILRDAGFRVRGSDVSGDVIEEARGTHPDIAFVQKSIYDLEPEADAAELVVCCEVLEHLDEPEKALDILASLAREHLLVSVPREPIWRALNMARGKYLGALGNTPGHLNHWSSSGFRRFLERSFDVVAVRRPLPWTMVLCAAKGRGR